MTRLSWIALLAVLTACGGNDGNTGTGPIGGVTPPVSVLSTTWVDSAWVQPVPAWGSSVRLDLPVPLDSIILTGATGARYTVDESGPRAIMRLEWKLGSYPDSISSKAATYIERKNVYLGLDAQQLGLLPP